MFTSYLIYWLCGILNLWFIWLGVLSTITLVIFTTIYLVIRFEVNYHTDEPIHDQTLLPKLKKYVTAGIILTCIFIPIASFFPSQKDVIGFYVATQLDKYNINIKDSKLSPQKLLDLTDKIVKRVHQIIDETEQLMNTQFNKEKGEEIK